METIRTEHLCKSHKNVFRLGPLDLRIADGEVLGVMGPNGAGKTTLLRLLWGFTKPDTGRISIFGMEPHLEQIKVRLRAGYLSENPRFYSTLTTIQFLRFIGSFYERWHEMQAWRFLDELGVHPEWKVEQLSQENRVKVGLISAMGHHPSLLILDEPTSGLDSMIRLELLRFLRKQANMGTTIVLSSHISDDIDQIANSILMLHKGRVMEYARPSDLIGKYGKPRMEEILVAAINNQRHS